MSFSSIFVRQRDEFIQSVRGGTAVDCLGGELDTRGERFREVSHEESRTRIEQGHVPRRALF